MADSAILTRQQINWETIDALYSGEGELPNLEQITLDDGVAAIDGVRAYIIDNGCKQVAGSIVLPSGQLTKPLARTLMGANFTELRSGTFRGPMLYQDEPYAYVQHGMAIYTRGATLVAET